AVLRRVRSGQHGPAGGPPDHHRLGQSYRLGRPVMGARGRRPWRGAGPATLAMSGLATLALKVADLDEAISFYESVGGTTHDRMVWNGSERADVDLGPLHLTLFTRAIYEDELSLPEECFLHPALFSDDLDA